MSNIYDLHRAAFAQVSAYVVTKTGTDGKPDRVATIAFKYPRDGAGRLYCYLHVFGGPMVRGFASGGGYDKQSASASAAARKIQVGEYAIDSQLDAITIREALLPDGGHSWDHYLRNAGFTVLQAV